MVLTETEIAARLATGASALRDAGERALRLHRAGLPGAIEEKPSSELVSDADRDLERHVRGVIGAVFAEDGFFGEETGGRVGPVTWVLDPIDGTSNFIAGIDYWCMSLALFVDDEIVAACVFDPCRNEMFTARRGFGACCDGRRLALTDQRKRTRIVGGAITRKGRHLESLSFARRAIEAGCSFRCFGAGALALAHIAAGRIDGFFEPDMKIWDFAAGRLLVTEAGGWFVGDASLHAPHETRAIAAGTPADAILVALMEDALSEAAG